MFKIGDKVIAVAFGSSKPEVQALYRGKTGTVTNPDDRGYVVVKFPGTRKWTNDEFAFKEAQLKRA